MQIRGVPDIDTMQGIIQHVSIGRYDGNVIADRLERLNGKALTCTLRVRSTSGPGARRAPTNGNRPGRHLIACCWHAHRDVMLAVFATNPDARITTMMADYRGFGSFMDEYLYTASHEVGSRMEPSQYAKLCDCAIHTNADVERAVTEATRELQFRLRESEQRLTELRAIDTALIHANLRGQELDLLALQKSMRPKRRRKVTA